ncbi:MAG: hypothetical protein ACMUHY_02965 [Thermoplasmatota archaeon]
MFRTSDPNATFNWTGSADHAQDISYFIRIGTEEFSGDVLEWRDMGVSTRIELGELELGVGIYSVQIMALKQGNYSRVTAGHIKINDYSLSTEHPETHEAFKGERGIRITKPVKCYITNHAAFDDNVTIELKGDLVDQDWAYLSASESSTHTTHVNTSAGRSTDEPVEFTITIAAPDTARRGDYVLTYTLISEDGATILDSGEILVTLENAPDEGGSENFADDLSGVITDVLPFLEGLPPGLVILIFFVLFFLIVGGIIFLGIFIARKKEEKKKKDPLAEQKRVYKEIYGREPTEEELRMMQAQSREESVDDFVKAGEAVSKTEEDLQEPPSGLEEEEGELDASEEDDVEPPTEGDGIEETEGVPQMEERKSSGDSETDDLLERLFD